MKLLFQLEERESGLVLSPQLFATAEGATWLRGNHSHLERFLKSCSKKSKFKDTVPPISAKRESSRWAIWVGEATTAMANNVQFFVWVLLTEKESSKCPKIRKKIASRLKRIFRTTIRGISFHHRDSKNNKMNFSFSLPDVPVWKEIRSHSLSYNCLRTLGGRGLVAVIEYWSLF